MAGDNLLLSVRVKALLLEELNIVAKEQGCVDFELIEGIILTDAALPKAPKPRRATRPIMTANERNAADGIVKEDLDRKAVAVTYFAETEVINWTRISEPDRVLINRGSMSYCRSPPPSAAWIE